MFLTGSFILAFEKAKFIELWIAKSEFWDFASIKISLLLLSGELDLTLVILFIFTLLLACQVIYNFQIIIKK